MAQYNYDRMRIVIHGQLITWTVNTIKCTVGILYLMGHSPFILLITPKSFVFYNMLMMALRFPYSTQYRITRHTIFIDDANNEWISVNPARRVNS